MRQKLGRVDEELVTFGVGRGKHTIAHLDREKLCARKGNRIVVKGVEE